MTRYRFTVEFDSDGNPGKWIWPDMLDLDDTSDGTVADWSTWNVEEIGSP